MAPKQSMGDGMSGKVPGFAAPVKVRRRTVLRRLWHHGADRMTLTGIISRLPEANLGAGIGAAGDGRDFCYID
jgi:hypothetical protein